MNRKIDNNKALKESFSPPRQQLEKAKDAVRSKLITILNRQISGDAAREAFRAKQAPEVRRQVGLLKDAHEKDKARRVEKAELMALQSASAEDESDHEANKGFVCDQENIPLPAKRTKTFFAGQSSTVPGLLSYFQPITPSA
jgi:hypothetical protein